LGEVRDGDVLLARLRASAGRLDAPDAATPVLTALQESRDAAFVRLLQALRTERYVTLLDRLVDAAAAPRLRDNAGERATGAVPALVRRPWHKLAKHADRLPPHPDDAQLHELRIRTKRVRYAAEAAAPVVGKQARALARAAADLQEVLGDLNDAVVAARW